MTETKQMSEDDLKYPNPMIRLTFGCVRDTKIDETTGCSMSRPAWNGLMDKVRPNNSLVVARLDRF